MGEQIEGEIEQLKQNMAQLQNGVKRYHTSGRAIEVVSVPPVGSRCHYDRQYVFTDLGGFRNRPGSECRGPWSRTTLSRSPHLHAHHRCAIVPRIRTVLDSCTDTRSSVPVA